MKLDLIISYHSSIYKGSSGLNQYEIGSKYPTILTRKTFTTFQRKARCCAPWGLWLVTPFAWCCEPPRGQLPGIDWDPIGPRPSPALRAAISTEYFNCWISLANCLVEIALVGLELPDATRCYQAALSDSTSIIFHLGARQHLQIDFSGQTRQKRSALWLTCKPLTCHLLVKELLRWSQGGWKEKLPVEPANIVEFCQFPIFSPPSRPAISQSRPWWWQRPSNGRVLIQKNFHS